jgi:Domain of unknown function (DUF4160)
VVSEGADPARHHDRLLRPGRRFPAGGAGGAAKVDIENLEVIAGYLPRCALGLVLDWAELHQRELRDNWALAQQRKPLNDITPFE